MSGRKRPRMDEETWSRRGWMGGGEAGAIKFSEVIGIFFLEGGYCLHEVYFV